MSEKKEVIINYEKWHIKCREFMIYFDGYTRGASVPIRKLINLFGELEKIVFKETKTSSWV